MTWIVLKNVTQVLGTMLLYWNLFDVFFMVRPGLQVTGRKAIEIKYHFYHMTLSVHIINMIYDY